MADFWNFQIDDDLDEEDASASRTFTSSRDCMLIMLDCSESMLTEKAASDVEENADSCLRLALKALLNLVCRKCISGEQEFMAIILLNTENTSNEHSFQNMVVWQELRIPDAELAKRIDRLVQSDDLKTDINAITGGAAECKWEEAFWLSAMLVATKQINFGMKRLFLFTNRADPSNDDQQSRRKILQKIEDLKNQRTEIQVIPTGEDFDGQFWDRALGFPVGDNKTLDELLEDVRRKEVKRRSLGNVPFQMGNGFQFSVGIYNTVAKATVPSAVHLERQKNEEVKTVTTYFNTDTGEKLRPEDMQKAQVYGRKQITLENEEVESLRRLCEPGFVLLGFKPISYLKTEHHVRSCLFLYPDDSSVKGSTCVYRSLLIKCLEKEKMAVCRLTARRNMPPKLVCLLPQTEIKDEDGSVVESAGFHVVFLPFADDLRDLTKITTRENAPKASTDEVELAKKMVRKLMIKYHPDYFQNPALQKHYKNLEDIALDRKLDETRQLEDTTKPNIEQMTKRAGDEMTAFANALFPAGCTSGTKRKAGAASAAAAKIARGEDYLKSECAAGRLEKLTVAILKEEAATNGIRLKNTRKADIINEIRSHFASS